METALFAKRPTEKSGSDGAIRPKRKFPTSRSSARNGSVPQAFTSARRSRNSKRRTASRSFSGLGWDYGGLVKDWRGGALGTVKPTHGGPGNMPPDCRMDVELAWAPSAPEAATAAA